MEPVEYAKVARRHWKLLVLLVAAAVGLVYWTSPERPTTTYEASHVLLVEQAETGGRSDNPTTNPEVLALRTTVGEVPVRVAAKLGFTGDPAELARDVAADAAGEVGTVTITGTATQAARAQLLANTFAEELLAWVAEREAARVAEETAQNAATEQSLRERIGALDGAIAVQPPPPNLETLRAERETLLRQLGDVLDRGGTTAPVGITTLQAATTASADDGLPGTQSRTERMVLAGLVALLLGFGLAVVLDRSDTRLRTRREVEAAFGLPVIAEIPLLFRSDRRRKLVMVDQPDSGKAESYRGLRAAVMLFRGREGRRAPERAVVLVTSPSPTEGKTTTVANLAVAYAETGRSVLVLSCDVWRSTVADRLGVRHGRGVSDFLASNDGTPLSAYVNDSAVRGVRVVVGGRAVRRPGGRLTAEHRLIKEARELADVVIVDTAPITSASLTRELSTMVDAVVVVSRVGRTTASQAERCAELLEQMQAPALGVVLLGVSRRGFSGYGPYGERRGDAGVVLDDEEAWEAEADEPAPRLPAAAAGPASRPDVTPAASDGGAEGGAQGRAAGGRDARHDPAPERAPVPPGSAAARPDLAEPLPTSRVARARSGARAGRSWPPFEPDGGTGGPGGPDDPAVAAGSASPAARGNGATAGAPDGGGPAVPYRSGARASTSGNGATSAPPGNGATPAPRGSYAPSGPEPARGEP